MAGRPKKNTVDYFPHMMGEGKKMAYIETKYGNDGYATWYKILETLAKTEDHYLNLGDEINAMYLCGKCRTTIELMYTIINDLVVLNAFDRYLWQHKILWSADFIESIRDTYKRRKSVSLDYSNLCRHLVNINLINVDINSISVGINAGKKENRRIGEIENRRSGEEGGKIDDVGNGDFGSIPEPDTPPVPDRKPWHPLTHDDVRTDLLSAVIWHGELGTSLGITDPGDVPRWIALFIDFVKGTGKLHSSIQDARSHCYHWVRNRINLGHTPDTPVVSPKQARPDPGGDNAWRFDPKVKPPFPGDWRWIDKLNRWVNRDNMSQSDRNEFGI